MTKPVHINLQNDYIVVTQCLGSNLGGFFKKKRDDKDYYIKWLEVGALKSQTISQGKTYPDRSRNLFNNEFLALKLYELYSVAVPKAEFITFTDDTGKLCYGIATEKKNNLLPLNQASSSQFETICQKAQEDFLIDALFSNYDVVGLRKDNMHFDATSLTPFRLDTGGALKYGAQGKPKKEVFNNEVHEFEEMESGLNTKTGFNPSTLANASAVFKGVHDSPNLLIGLKKLLAVSDAQIIECVKEHGFDEDTDKGRKKNAVLIETLLERKKTLIAKAEEKIFNKMIKDFLQSKPSDSDSTYQQRAEGGFRSKHGGMHASRVALYTEKWVSLLQDNGYKPAQQLTPKDLFLIKAAAMFHDSGRQRDSGNDDKQWELDGAQKCGDWLRAAGFAEEDIQKVVEAIAHKDDRAVQSKNIYALVLAASDSLDWVRSHGSTFDTHHLPEQIKATIPEKDLLDFAREAKKLAYEQGDSPLAQFDLPGDFNITKKEEYELCNPQGCYGAAKHTYLSLGRLDAKKQVQEQQIERAKQAVSGSLDPVQFKEIVTQAIHEKNWEVLRIIHEKAPLISNVAQLLLNAVSSKNWQDVFEIQKAFHAEDYILTEGPLEKSEYTFQLEKLAKDLMDESNFELKGDDSGKTVIVVNGTTYNLSDIIKHANFDQVTLNISHFESYRQFMANYPDFGMATATLEPAKEKAYQDKLYEAYTRKGNPIPEPPINFQEMQAINIYSSEFFRSMNRLMRGDFSPSNDKDTLKAAIIHSVMCASGLQKIPETVVKEAYRIESTAGLPEEVWLQYMDAALRKGVVPLTGFMSTSASPGMTAFMSISDSPKMTGNITFHFTNIRGVYIVPIARRSREDEFLMPPTQIQLNKYHCSGGKHYFEASMVNDLGQEEQYDVADPNGLMRIFQVILREDRRIIKVLTNPKTIDTLKKYYNLTLLNLAMPTGSVKIVNELMSELRQSAQLVEIINFRDAYGNTPLISGVLSQNTDMVAALISYGANINLPDINGSTPLMLAVKGGSIEIARIILKAAIKQDAKIDYTQLIKLATENNDLNMAQLLVAVAIDPVFIDSHSPFIQAVKDRNKPVMTELIQFSNEDELDIGLMTASMNQDVESVGILIGAGASLDRMVHGETPLMIAVKKKQIAMIGALIQAGANCNVVTEKYPEENLSALMIAAQRGDFEVVHALTQGLVKHKKIDKLSFQNRYGQTALMIAAQEGNLDVLNLLIQTLSDHGRINDLNLQDSHGYTAFMLAAVKGKWDVVNTLMKVFLEQGNIEAFCLKNNKQQNILFPIIAGGATLEVVKTLVDAFIKKGLIDELCVIDSDNNTALMKAFTCSSRHEILEVLIEGLIGSGRSDVLILEDSFKRTALSLAIDNEQLEQASVLINALVRVGRQDALSTPDSFSRTPLDILIEKNIKNTDLIQHLISNLRNEDINKCHQNRSMTPLMSAVNKNNVLVLTALIERGANFDSIKNKKGLTPLMLAISKGYWDIVQILIHALVNHDKKIDLDFPVEVKDQFSSQAVECLKQAQRLIETCQSRHHGQAGYQGLNSMGIFSASSAESDPSPTPSLVSDGEPFQKEPQTPKK